jgi:hypothetical protein
MKAVDHRNSFWRAVPHCVRWGGSEEGNVYLETLRLRGKLGRLLARLSFLLIITFVPLICVLKSIGHLVVISAASSSGDPLHPIQYATDSPRTGAISKAMLGQIADLISHGSGLLKSMVLVFCVNFIVFYSN